METINKYVGVLLALIIVAGAMVGCGSRSGADDGSADTKTLNFAYQYGLQYLPALIMKKNKLIEKYYDDEVIVNWQVLNSGDAVDSALKSNKINGGLMGTAVAVSGINRKSPYKIISGISNMNSRLITDDKSIKSLSDFKEKDKIALVNYGSTQHMILAMAAKEILGDAHALDDNIVAMAHPDGMTALYADSVQAHYTVIPYWNKELEVKRNHEIKEASGKNTAGSTKIVAILNTDVYKEDPELYNAVNKAFKEAMAYVNDEKNFEAIAENTHDTYGVTKEEMMEYLNSSEVTFGSAVTGLMEMVDFMEDEGYLDSKASKEVSDYVYEGVTVE